MRMSDWSSDVCSSDLNLLRHPFVDHAAADADLFLRRQKLLHQRGRTVDDPADADAGNPERLRQRGDADDMVAERGGERQLRGQRQIAIGFVDQQQAAALLREGDRSEEHTSELQSQMRNTYAGFCLTKK